MSFSKDALIDIPSNTGGFVMREVVRFAFFVRKPHKEIAPTIVQAVNQIIDLLPPPALSMFAIDSGDWVEFSSDGLKQQVYHRLIGEEGPSINGRMSLSGGQANIPDCALEYKGLAMDRPAFNNSAAVLWFHAVTSTFEPRRGQLLLLWREIATLLNCSAAYIDLALEGNQSRIQAVARRYRCLDISSPDCVARDVEDKIPGIFWKNYFGPQLVNALGGRSVIDSAISNTASTEELNNGALIITLGDEPTRGDTNRQKIETDRNALAHLAYAKGLLHIPRRVRYFDATESLSDTEAQENWHMRFVK